MLTQAYTSRTVLLILLALHEAGSIAYIFTGLYT